MARARLFRQAGAVTALLPAAAIVVVVYVGSALWAARISTTTSRIIPISDYVGARQYLTLFANNRWDVSVWNLLNFGVLFVAASLVLGFLMAILIDQRVRGENLLRSLYLYPYSMSFIVTGFIWHRLLDPSFGIEKLVRSYGWEGFRFDWIVDPDRVIYTIVIAAIWHAAGLVMVIALAGLRGIDGEILKAARVDGIPAWKTYLFIVLPMLRGSAATAAVLLSLSVVRLYDLVVAMTHGGPGIASEVPAKFVMDHLFERANIGLATAASTVMLVTVLAVVVPWVYAQHMWQRRAAA